ncbi:hypothetical protein ACFZB9_33475 [Kitasatospora sp. NPDC008050]|uniref:hypothetical protein n=1 Tax=Kitasatospora sp. NPDC008050 TaxID=3364021 RepID=UPI0036E46AE3
MSSTSVDISGLRLTLLEQPGAHTAGAVLRIGAGSADDRAPSFGAAHLAEHLRIAAGPPGPASMPPVRGVTDNTGTTFSAVCLAEDAPALGARLAALLGTSELPADTVEAERQAVLVELRQAAGQPLLALGPAVAAAACPGHGLAATGWADPASVARLDPAQVHAFTDRHYRRENAELVLAGAGLAIDRILAAVDAAARPGAGTSVAATADAATSVAATATATGAPNHQPAVPNHEPAAPDDEPAAPALAAELDGLVVLSLVRGPERTDHCAALLGRQGTAEAAAARLGHPVLGRTAVAGRGVAVELLCWRAGSDTPALAAALARESAELWSAAARPEALARAGLQRRQDAGYRAWTPLGAAAALLDRSRVPSAPRVLPPAGPHSLALWRVERGALRRHA